MKSEQATAAAIAANIMVTRASGLISAAGVTDVIYGVTIAPIPVSGYGTIRLWSAPGTFLLTASAAITIDAPLFPTAVGTVDDAGTTGLGLIALEAATAAGDIIECARFLKGA
jgi:hypothetical protein